MVFASIQLFVSPVDDIGNISDNQPNVDASGVVVGIKDGSDALEGRNEKGEPGDEEEDVAVTHLVLRFLYVRSRRGSLRREVFRRDALRDVLVWKRGVHVDG